MTDNGPDRIDYVARWRELVRARQDQGRRLDRLGNRPDAWGGQRAERFRRMTSRPGPVDPLLALIEPNLRPEMTVLDVGAGAGRHVVRIAPRVARVVAVEPSPAMREQLEGAIEEIGARNVTVVAGAWPDARLPVDVEPDLVICSHVAYFVEDIAPFLESLWKVTHRRGYVVHRHEQRERAVLDLFARVWGEPRRPEPAFADLYGAACQLGLWANATTIPFAMPISFANLDEAVAAVQADLLNPESPAALETIRADLNERLVRRDDRLTFDLPPGHAGVLWWEARP